MRTDCFAQRRRDRREKNNFVNSNLLSFPAASAPLREILLAVVLLSSDAHAADQPPGYAVATAHPLATQAGIEILDRGGNAFDAAVAVSAALAVVEPASSGIGGGGFWLLHRESDGMQTFVDGRETAPSAATATMYLDGKGEADPNRSRSGALAAAIPGAPAAWVHIAQKYGSKPLAELLAPSIRLARDGFAADSKLTSLLRILGDRLSPGAAYVFLPKNKAADRPPIRQPELAATLERLAREGRDGFYTGAVAQKLVDGVRAGGGIWTLEDLLKYRVIERKPLTFYFRDHRIVSAPAPSAGGVALAQMLAILEALAWPVAGDAVQSRHLVVEALRRAYRDRTAYLGDPDFVSIPGYRLLSREYALELARGITPDRATPSTLLAPQTEGDNTTHFSVLDSQGNRVAGTLTINLPFGSGFMPPGTGVLLNNEMDDFAASETASNAYGLAGSKANAIAPGKRPLSSMTPTFVEGPRGLLILGTPGGSRITSMVLLSLLGFTQGLNAQQLVDLPRYHHQYLPDQIEFEPGALSADEQAGLKALGHELRPLTAPYGNMHAVWWDKNGNRLEAASDPRGVGSGEVRPPGTVSP